MTTTTLAADDPIGPTTNERLDPGYPDLPMKQLLIRLVWNALDELGALQANATTIPDCMKAAGIVPAYTAWFSECIRVFAGEGHVSYTSTSGGFRVVSAPAEGKDELWRQWQRVKAKWLQRPELEHGHKLLETAVLALPEVLTGTRAATEVIFPNASLSLVENAYKSNPAQAFFNSALAHEFMAQVRRLHAADPNHKIRIAEVGAGTGATTVCVLETIARHGVAVAEYCYTDISRAFLKHAEENYLSGSPFLERKILDIERSPAEQGFETGTYDIVIAGNVLHATRGIRRTLRNSKALLARGGVLLLNEMTGNTMFNHLTFGLLEGWWLYEDPGVRMPGGPGLSVDSWHDVLDAEGFEQVDFPYIDGNDLGQQIIIARSDGLIRLPDLERKKAEADKDAAAASKPAAGGSSGPSAINDHIARAIVEELADALEISSGRVALDEPFSSYGLDSILAVQLAQGVSDRLEIDLDVMVMFEHGTAEALRSYIIDEFELVPIKESSGKAEAETPDEVPGENKVQPDVPLDSGESMADSVHDDVRDEPQGHTEPHSPGYAIVGMSGQFPGADDLDEFWQVVVDGRSCVSRPPMERDDWRAYAGQESAEELWGGFLTDIAGFDPAFFGLAISEARQMTPEQRLMLMHAWNALEHAGHTPRELSRRTTGVFIAVTSSEYANLARQTGDLNMMAAPAPSLVPNRISYHLNLSGPSEYCETACSSSLVAVHRAIAAMERGECEQAIVGGVNLVCSPDGFVGMDAAGMLSANGDVRPFQADGVGTVRGEGAAAILIKPLDVALASGDFIHAVIRGSGVAHGGRGVSLTAPNITGMRAAIQQGYDNSGIEPSSLSYIEAHGMSTKLADCAEMKALGLGLTAESATSQQTPVTCGPVAVGCLKPCFGHTEVVSGLAALLKTALAMRHGVVPAIPDFDRLHPDINLGGTRLEPVTRTREWQRATDDSGQMMPRRAGIHSFGIGGVNAYMIVEEAPSAANELPSASDSSVASILVISAKSPAALRMRGQQLMHWLESNPGVGLEHVAFTLQLGREQMDHRAAFVAEDAQQAAAILRDWLEPATTNTTSVVVAGPDERNDELIDLCTNDIGAALLNNLFAENDLETIAAYWVKGVAIDWFRLHGERARRRLPLPGYPFDEVRCWLDGERPSSSDVVDAVDVTTEANEAPRGELFEFVAGSAASVLGLERDDFDGTKPLEAYGMNSMLLVQLGRRISAVYPQVSNEALLSARTVADLAATIGESTSDLTLVSGRPEQAVSSQFVRLNDHHQGTPVFWVHAALGSVETYQEIASSVSRPFYGIQAKGFMSTEVPTKGISAMAAQYIELIRSVQPSGPYDIGGFCLGGLVSYEVARQLQSDGQDVRSLVMVDSPDISGFAQAAEGKNITTKNAALQVANTLLWPAGESALARICPQLIHSSEVDASLEEDEFVVHLAQLAKARGLPMSEAAAAAFIRQNLRVQVAYQIGGFVIEPLPRPEQIRAIYFRNRGGKFLGELADYFQAPGESFELDGVQYWKDWQRELQNLEIIDVDAANHMTLLFDRRSLATIVNICAGVYAGPRPQPKARVAGEESVCHV